MKRSDITVELVKSAYADIGYRMHYDGKLNNFGVRSLDMTAGVFNDFMGILWYESGKPKLIVHSATVDPGSYYLNNPMNPAGTAVMKFQQILDGYIYGLHQNKYGALIQAKPAYFYRITKEEFLSDNEGKNKNEFLINIQGKKVIFEAIGANLHRAHSSVILYDVDKFSAACQVRNDPAEYKEFMDLVNEKLKIQKTFDYALFGEQQFTKIAINFQIPNSF